MPRTVSEAFEKFKMKCEPTSPTKELTSEKQRYLRQSIEGKIDAIDDFLIGSYAKQTQIRPRSDTDLFIVLDSAYWNEHNLQTPHKIFLLLRKELKKIYPKTKIKINGQAIQLFFRDGFKFDVVPAYESNNGHIIPNLTKRVWVYCNPKLNIEFLSKLNKKMDMKLKPLIKMIKCWRKSHSVKLTSFHLELLVANCFTSFSPQSLKNLPLIYPRAIAHIFHNACHLIDEPMYDEVNERIDEYLDRGDLRRVVWRKLFNASQNALMACHLQENNKHSNAIICWRKVFGSYFVY